MDITDNDTQTVDHSRSLGRGNLVILSGLLLIAGLLYLPFVYKGTTGETDTMRMAIGVLKSISAESSYSGYNHGISFAYYRMLEAFAPVFAADRESVLSVMNFFNAVTAVLFVIPFFYLVRRYWGVASAIGANIVLMFVPVWWNTSLYGHPMLQAAFLTFVGLWLLGNRGTQSNGARRSSWADAIIQFAALSVFALALMFRLDAVLMFPLITAVLWLGGDTFKGAFWRSLTYGLLALGLAVVTKALVSGTGLSDGADMPVLERLVFWHNPVRGIQNVVRGTLIFLSAFHPLFVALCLGACLYLLHEKDYRTLFFLLGVLLVNYLFWLPNPSPARHFVYGAPVMAVGVAVLLTTVASRFARSQQLRLVAFSSGLATLSAVGSVVVSELLFPVAKAYYPWKHGVQEFSGRAPIRSIFLNKYYVEADFRRRAELAEKLLALQPRTRTILVITDSILPFLVKMAALSDVAALSIAKSDRGIPEVRVMTEHNTFLIPIAHKTNPLVLLNETSAYDDCDVIVDRTNAFRGLTGADFRKPVRLVE